MRELLAVAVLLSAAAADARAADHLWIGNAEDYPGTPEIRLGLYAQHADPLHAFSAAFRYDAAVLDFVRAEFDAPDVATSAAGYEYARVRPDAERGEVALGVVLDVTDPYQHQAIPPAPSEPQLLAWLVFAIKSSAMPGAYLVQPYNGLGSPPIENVFSVYGRSVLPDLDAGEVRVLNPHHLTILPADGTAGGTATVVFEAEHVDELAGYQLSLRYPSDVLEIDLDPLDDPFDPDENEFVEEDQCLWPITWCGLGLDSHLTAGVDSFSAWALPEFDFAASVPGTGSGWLLANVLFDLTEPFQNLPVGRHQILKIVFAVDAAASVGSTVPLTLVDGTGIPETFNIFVIPIPNQLAVSVRPELHHGEVTIVRGFRRGLINGDAHANLADVIFLLGYLFASGAEPSCLKAADNNDDGKLDIADAVRLLGWLFRGAAPPLAPFGACGADPTADNLSCESPPGC
jgi:hypothetical protein